MGLSRTAKSWMLPALLVLLGAAWHPPANEMPPQRGVAVTIDNRSPVVPIEAGSRIDWRIERPPLLSRLFVR